MLAFPSIPLFPCWWVKVLFLAAPSLGKKGFRKGFVLHPREQFWVFTPSIQGSKVLCGSLLYLPDP